MVWGLRQSVDRSRRLSRMRGVRARGTSDAGTTQPTIRPESNTKRWLPGCDTTGDAVDGGCVETRAAALGRKESSPIAVAIMTWAQLQ